MSMFGKVCADEIHVAVNSRVMSVSIVELSASNRPPTKVVELTSDEDPAELITSMIRELRRVQKVHWQLSGPSIRKLKIRFTSQLVNILELLSVVRPHMRLVT